MDLGLLIIRGLGGFIMLAHGWPKWPNRSRVAASWAQGGMPVPHVAVPVAYIVEVPGGLLYMLGLLTGWTSVLMVAFMLVVTWWSIGVRREPLVSFGVKGYDVNLALLAMFLATALAGAGRYSLDAALAISPYWPMR